MAVVVVATTSCKKTKAPAGENWGYTEYYEGSFIKEYKPVIMTRTLSFDLNIDAATMLINGGEVQFQISSSKDCYEAPQNIRTYFNGELCKDNYFVVQPQDKADGMTITGDLGLEFDGAAAEGEHTLYLRYCGCVFNGPTFEGERVYTSEMDVEIIGALEDGIIIKKKDIANPGHVLLGWILGIIATLLFVWIAFLRRIFYPRIGRNLQIVGDEVGCKTIQAKGCYRVVFTNTYKKQNILHRIFVGKILYEDHPWWASDVTFTGNAPKNKVQMICRGVIYCDARYLQPNNEYEICNSDTKEKVSLRIM